MELKVSVGDPYAEMERRIFWDRADHPAAIAGWRRQLPPAITAIALTAHLIYQSITSDLIDYNIINQLNNDRFLYSGNSATSQTLWKIIICILNVFSQL